MTAEDCSAIYAAIFCNLCHSRKPAGGTLEMSRETLPTSTFSPSLRSHLALAALASEMRAPRGAQSLSLPLPSSPLLSSPPPLSFFLIRHVYFLSLAALAINSKKSALAALAH